MHARGHAWPAGRTVAFDALRNRRRRPPRLDRARGGRTDGLLLRGRVPDDGDDEDGDDGHRSAARTASHRFAPPNRSCAELVQEVE